MSRRLLVPALASGIGERERAAVLRRFREGALRAVVLAAAPADPSPLPRVRVAVIAGGPGTAVDAVERLRPILAARAGREPIAYAVHVLGTGERWIPRGPEGKEEDAPAAAHPS